LTSSLRKFKRGKKKSARKKQRRRLLRKRIRIRRNPDTVLAPLALTLS
jgi:hypothetical protein